MQLTAINGIDLLNQTGIIEHLKQNSATQLIFDTKDVIEEKKDNEEMMNIVSNFITDADKETLCKICGTKWKYPSHLKRHLNVNDCDKFPLTLVEFFIFGIGADTIPVPLGAGIRRTSTEPHFSVTLKKIWHIFVPADTINT
ncbi:Cell wall integrity transcriptional regulator [Dirofilaria immitis]